MSSRNRVVYRNLTNEQRNSEIEKKRRELERYVLKISRQLQPLDFDDLAQETWLKAHRSLDTWDPSKDFKIWISKIAVRLSLDFNRKKNRRVKPVYYEDFLEVNGVSAEFEDTHIDVHKQIIEEIERIADRADLEEIFAHLSIEEVALIRMIDLDRHSYQEAANELEVSVSVVKTRLNNVRHKVLYRRAEEYGLLQPSCA